MNYEVDNYHLLPSIFGNSRKKAEIFQKYWRQYISPGNIIYTRRGEGKEIITQFFRQKQIPIHQKKKEIWIESRIREPV